jgi:hypothetical protein
VLAAPEASNPDSPIAMAGTVTAVRGTVAAGPLVDLPVGSAVTQGPLTGTVESGAR